MLTASPRRLALLCATAAVLAGVLVTPAGAAATRPKFELSSVTKTPYPRFAVRPGQTVTGAVRVRSRLGRSQMVRLQALDLVTARTGGIEFAIGSPHATGAWLTLQRRDIQLPARASRIVRFTARVPADAAPGQHFGGIVAINRAELLRAQAPARRAGVELRSLTRIALPVRFSVPGAAVRELDARGVAFAADASGSRLDLDLRSTGHLLVRETAIDLQVAQASGRKLFRRQATLSEFIPQTAIRYPIAWQGTPKPGTYRVTGTVKPTGGRVIRVDERVTFGKPQAKRVEQQTGVAPSDGRPPLMLIAALGAALLLAIAASAGYLRLRRRLARAQAVIADGV